MNQIKAGQVYFPQSLPQVQQRKKTAAQPEQSFGNVLQQKIQEKTTEQLQFSNHALQRLEKRGITLNQEELTKLAGAVEKAGQKGARESLILMNNVAYIVSVPNKKVITAVDSHSMQDNVFTNIDSAIIVNE
jgi:flagellar operon protein